MRQEPRDLCAVALDLPGLVGLFPGEAFVMPRQQAVALRRLAPALPFQPARVVLQVALDDLPVLPRTDLVGFDLQRDGGVALAAGHPLVLVARDLAVEAIAEEA